MNQFENAAQPLSPSDINEVERKIGRKLPAPLVAAYLRNNGGRPVRRYFSDERGGEHALHAFLPMKYRVSENTVLFEETYVRVVTDKRLIPDSLIPFAVNEGNDFYCIDERTGEIVFYAMDHSQERQRAIRKVAPSLDAFIEQMQTEDDFYG